ncbi:MAG: phosphoethanolamine transferase [Thermodesulfobacteriota bacterium]
MKKTSEYLVAVFLLAVLYNFLYNHHFLGLWAEGRWESLAQYMATSIVMVFGLFVLLSMSRPVLSVSLPFTFLVSAIADHFIAQYRIRSFCLNTVGFAFETNLEEASGFTSATLVLWALAGAAMASVAVIVLRRLLARTPRKPRLLVLFSSLLLSTALHFTTGAPMALPFNVFESTFSYLEERYRFERLSQNKEDISGHTPCFHGEDLVVVLVIGESARSDHFHINGYPRQTSPNLERLGAFSFKDVEACGVSTRTAVPCMLTRATRSDMEVASRETSFISIFRRLGFHTVWLSNQRFLGKANTKVSAIAREAELVYYNDKQADNIHMRLLDEDLLGPFLKALRHPSPRKLIVFHTVGSHWLYDRHYTDRFRVFDPVCQEKSQRHCALEEVVNAYDNTILYTDHFIAQVIEAVADLKALVFYVSDHGESLGEGGRYGHGHEEGYPEQRAVPMFVWVSDRYASEEKPKAQSLEENQTKALSHDHLFHSILDCSGIESPIVDTAMSICRPLR